MILRRAVHARNHSNPHASRTARQCRRGRGESFRRKTIPDHCDLPFGQALCNEPLRRCVRIAHNSITPAKHHGLRPRLHRREQIAELALAADYRRHARQPRRRPQRQVRIEIKRMGNRDLLFPKPSAQSHPRFPRLESIQTSAEPEALNVHSIEERPFCLDAAQADAKLLPVQGTAESYELTLAAPCLQAVDHQEDVGRRRPRHGIRITGRRHITLYRAAYLIFSRNQSPSPTEEVTACGPRRADLQQNSGATAPPSAGAKFVRNGRAVRESVHPACDAPLWHRNTRAAWFSTRSE